MYLIETKFECRLIFSTSSNIFFLVRKLFQEIFQSQCIPSFRYFCEDLSMSFVLCVYLLIDHWCLRPVCTLMSLLSTQNKTIYVNKNVQNTIRYFSMQICYTRKMETILLYAEYKIKCAISEKLVYGSCSLEGTLWKTLCLFLKFWKNDFKR